jgi:hypothetical protein
MEKKHKKKKIKKFSDTLRIYKCWYCKKEYTFFQLLIHNEKKHCPKCLNTNLRLKKLEIKNQLTLEL